MQVGEGMGKLVYYRTGVDMPRSIVISYFLVRVLRFAFSKSHF